MFVLVYIYVLASCDAVEMSGMSAEMTALCFVEICRMVGLQVIVVVKGEKGRAGRG
jgi:hypothetical protein